MPEIVYERSAIRRHGDTPHAMVMRMSWKPTQVLGLVAYKLDLISLH